MGTVYIPLNYKKWNISAFGEGGVGGGGACGDGRVGRWCLVTRSARIVVGQRLGPEVRGYKTFSGSTQLRIKF